MGEPKLEPTMLVQLTTDQLRELAGIIRAEQRPSELVEREEWMSPEDAAKWLGIHVQTVHATIAAENPPWAKKFGRVTRISRSLLLQSPPVERKKVRR